MKAAELVKLTYTRLSVMAMLNNEHTISSNRPLWLIIIMNITWTDLSWQMIRATPEIQGNIAIRQDLETLATLYDEFHRCNTETHLVRAIHVVGSVEHIAGPVIRILNSMRKLRSAYDGFVTQLAVALIATVALHQMVLVKMRNCIKNIPADHRTEPISTITMIELVHTLSSVCTGRRILGTTLEWLVDVVVLLVNGSMPEDRKLRSRFKRVVIDTALLHSLANIVLENMFIETFDRADMWPQMVRLCSPEHLLDAQLRAANLFLQVHDGTFLSCGQKRLLQLRPSLSSYLSRTCACGCKARMPKDAKACAECKRVYYASPDCQLRHWPMHRDICKGIWTTLRTFYPKQSNCDGSVNNEEHLEK